MDFSSVQIETTECLRNCNPRVAGAESVGSFKTRLDKVLRSISYEEAEERRWPNSLPWFLNDVLAACSREKSAGQRLHAFSRVLFFIFAQTRKT